MVPTLGQRRRWIDVSDSDPAGGSSMVLAGYGADPCVAAQPVGSLGRRNAPGANSRNGGTHPSVSSKQQKGGADIRVQCQRLVQTSLCAVSPLDRYPLRSFWGL
jgi:hypothetical protein